MSRVLHLDADLWNKDMCWHATRSVMLQESAHNDDMWWGLFYVRAHVSCPARLSHGNTRAGDVAALAYTSLLGSAASYAVFFYYASKGNLAKLSSLTFLTPIFASLAGFWIADERLNSMQLCGAALTLTGIILMNGRSASTSEN
jgi:drug/metabolite transporter (DMT)-like permease